MRAGPDCEGETLEPAALPGIPVFADARHSGQDRALTEAPPEPNVYEDLFPIGSIPSEICTLHEHTADLLVAAGWLRKKQ